MHLIIFTILISNTSTKRKLEKKTSTSIKKIVVSEGSLPFRPFNKGDILPVFRPNMYTPSIISPSKNHMITFSLKFNTAERMKMNNNSQELKLTDRTHQACMFQFDYSRISNFIAKT